MKVTVTARHFTLTPSIEDFVNKKLEAMELPVDGTARAHVILSVDKYMHTAELVVNAGRVVRKAMAVSKDLYDAINKSVKKLDRELVTLHKKEREKVIRKSRKAKNLGLRS